MVQFLFHRNSSWNAALVAGYWLDTAVVKWLLGFFLTSKGTAMAGWQLEF